MHRADRESIEIHGTAVLRALDVLQVFRGDREALGDQVLRDDVSDLAGGDVEFHWV